VFPLVIAIPPRPRDILKLFLTRPGMAFAVAKFGARGLAPAIAATKRGDRDEALRLLGSAILGKEPFRRLSRERLAQARANQIDAELLGSLFPPLTGGQLKEVRCPVLLVQGDRSPPFTSHLTNVLGRLLPNVERVCIGPASHLVHEDEPSAFASAVVSFLSSRIGGPEHGDQPKPPVAPPSPPEPPISN